MPAVKNIVGPRLLEPAPIEMDCDQATDLIVLRALDIRIGVRVRDIAYHKRYGSQFTIRSKRDSGARTELSKILSGWGDWLFYGFGDNESLVIPHWTIIDLAMFRAWFKRINAPEIPNGDGTHFVAFSTASFPSWTFVDTSL